MAVLGSPVGAPSPKLPEHTSSPLQPAVQQLYLRCGSQLLLEKWPGLKGSRPLVGTSNQTFPLLAGDSWKQNQATQNYRTTG